MKEKNQLLKKKSYTASWILNFSKVAKLSYASHISDQPKKH